MYRCTGPIALYGVIVSLLVWFSPMPLQGSTVVALATRVTPAQLQVSNHMSSMNEFKKHVNLNESIFTKVLHACYIKTTSITRSLRESQHLQPDRVLFQNKVDVDVPIGMDINTLKPDKSDGFHMFELLLQQVHI